MHKKSGARVFLLKNSDENKVFCIGFRTPPPNSCGLPHILEHSVLCGSDRFPLKDPFMELEKSSLQTFLNAMTYSDKTIYPVASCNDQDFQNLMEVYMDAVFHPFIYRREEIFRQEGWHFEMDGADSPLTVNGVVYNEMKGAYSSPDDILARYTESALFPDTPYANDSGGDPALIPDLSYQQFLDFHATYYHPSNCYIYLYGDMDMEEKLAWLDREYLGAYDRKEIDSALPLQAPFDQPHALSIDYPIADGDDPKGQTWLSSHWAVGEITDPVLYRAFEVLDYVLLSSSGAILKKALREAGIGKDIFGGYHSEIRQPYFSLVAKDADADQAEAFSSCVRETLEKLVADGIEEKYLLAGINSMEFQCRAADYGMYPKGLVYGFMSFDSWLYDERDPLMHLRYEDTIQFLKDNVRTGYFEGLIRKYLLDNPHRADVTLNPVPGLMEQREIALAQRLEAYKASLSAEEVDEIVRAAAALKEYQNTPSTPEEIATLPVLKLSDISRKIQRFSTEEGTECGRPFLTHHTFTGGISYIHLLFDMSQVPVEELPIAALLRALLCLVDTKRRDYADLSNEISIYTGGMGNAIISYEKAGSDGEFTAWFDMSVKVLDRRVPDAFRLLSEILTESVFEDISYIENLIAEFRSRYEMVLSESGHATAANRARSYNSAVAWFGEQTSGIDYYRFLERCCGEDSDTEALAKEVADMARKLITAANLTVDVTASDEGLAAVKAELPALIKALPQGVPHEDNRYVVPADRLQVKNEGFKTPGQVVYAALCGNFRSSGMAYHGSMQVLRNILGSEYLWKNIRELGGAYGCMCRIARNGDTYFVSYRDPHFRRTIDVFKGIGDYVKEFTMDRGQMEKFIISTIGSMDRPLTPSIWGTVSLQAYLCGITDEMRAKEREEILNCTQEDIRALSCAILAATDCMQICVVGNAGTITRDEDLLYSTEYLSGSMNEDSEQDIDEDMNGDM